MKRFRHLTFVGFPFLCAGIITSCIDNSYDLDETDYTLGIETNITLPSCSTGDIYLRSFMDLEEDGIIQYVWDDNLNDSIFCVRKSGEADIAPIRIEEIKIKKPQLSQIETSINLRDIANKQAKQQNKIRITINNPILGEQNVDVEDQTFIYDLKEGDAEYFINNATAENISADVVSIEKVGFDAVVATFSINLQGFPTYIPYVHLDNLKLSYPVDLQISECKFNGKTCTIGEGSIQLSTTENNTIKASDGITLELTINGLQTGEGFTFDATQHKVSLNGEFSLDGAFRIETADFDAEELSKKVNSLTAADIQQFLSGDWGSLIPLSIGVKGNAAFDKDITIKTFTGEVRHDVGKVAPIKLDNLPDFLTDEDVVLDLDNPVLLLSVENEIPSTIHTDFELKSNTCDTPVKTEEMNIEYGYNPYYIADKETNTFPTSFFPDGMDIDVQRVGITGSVPALIRKIPEQIEINVSPVKLHAQEFDITKEYDVDINYEVFAPFTFGEDFKMVYSDTEQGWAKDLGDLDKLDAERLELKGKIDSDLPAELALTLIPLDKNGKEIKALEVSEVMIKGGVKNQDFTLTIKAAKGYSFNDVLAGKNGVNQLDGIKYSASITGEDKATLKKNANIRLHGMNVSIKGTVSYDAN